MALPDKDDVLARLNFKKFYEDYGLELKPAGSGFVAKCCFHEDSVASLSIETEERGMYKCHAGSCDAQGDVFAFYMAKEGVDFKAALKALAEMAGLSGAVVSIQPPAKKKVVAKKDPAPIPESTVLDYHKRLLKNEEWMLFLHEKRGLNTETIKHYKLGHDDSRYTIPIYNSRGKLVNIRRYKPFSTDKDKMISFGTGYGSATLYPARIPDGDLVVICEGELDCLVAIQEGFPAITSTGGAGFWDDKWSSSFSGKDIVIAYDNDKSGRNGAKKAAASLFGHAQTVRMIVWPDPFLEKYDVTDWFTSWSGNADSFRQLIDQSVLYEPPRKRRDPEPEQALPFEVNLSSASNSDYVGKKIKMTIMVAGKITTPYQIPKTIIAECDRGMKSMCKGCGMFEKAEAEITLTDRDREIMSMVNCNDGQKKHAIAERLGIGSRKCPRWTHTIKNTMNLERLTAIPVVGGQLEQSEDNGEYVTRTIDAIGENLNVKTNIPYCIEGYSFGRPLTQSSGFLVGKIEPLEVSIDRFKMTEELTMRLLRFQPQPEQSVQQKMDEIAVEMSKVHQIWGRPDLQTVLDMSFHSVLAFRLFNQNQFKGYVETFIVGDSGCGKTSAALALSQYYRAGQRVQAEQSSAAGLIGGITKREDRYEVSWGPVVLADRTLLIIDEFSGIKDEDAERLTDVRSMGYAEIVKIERQRAPARTRFVFLTNPKQGRQLSTYEHGCDAIYPGLFRKAEDVRRIDLALAVASGEVSLEEINASHPNDKCTYTSDDCAALVLWAWSRKIDDIVFEDDVEATIREKAIALSRKYTSRLPLIEPGDVRWKLARLACATATRQFSTIDGVKLIVTSEHVRYVYDLIDRIYSSNVMAYDRYSMDHKGSEIWIESHQDEIIEGIHAMLEEPSEFVRLLLKQRTFSLTTIAAQLDVERKKVQQVVRFLTRNECIDSSKDGFYKRPGFIVLLRLLNDRGFPSRNGNHGMKTISEDVLSPATADPEIAIQNGLDFESVVKPGDDPGYTPEVEERDD